jgi:hypothetical protein
MPVYQVDMALIVLYERQYGTPVWYCPSLVYSKDSLSIYVSFFRFSYCLRQWIIREKIAYFQMYRRLYILNYMQCIAMIQLNMQIFAVCKSFCGGVTDYLIITYQPPNKYSRDHWMDRIDHICQVNLTRGSNLSRWWALIE